MSAAENERTKRKEKKRKNGNLLEPKELQRGKHAVKV
jgi:hypothetical protein